MLRSIRTTRPITAYLRRGKSSKSWTPEEATEVERVTQIALTHDLIQSATSSISTTVPWFLDNMPASYFRVTPPSVRTDHLKAISALKDTDMSLSVDIKSKLPEVDIFTTKDGSMCLNSFKFGGTITKAECTEERKAMEQSVQEIAQKVYDGELEYDGVDPAHCSPELVEEYVKKCSTSYLNNSVSRRFLKQMSLYRVVSGGEGVSVSIEDFNPSEYTNQNGDLPSGMSAEDNLVWIDTAVCNSLPQYALEYFSRQMKMNDLSVVRTHLDNVKDGETGNVTLLRMLVKQKDPSAPTPDWKRMKRNLKRQKWIDPKTAELMERETHLGVRRAEIITATASVLHPIMKKVNPIAFSKANIHSTLTNPANVPIAAEIADYFIEKFDPKTGRMSTEAMAEREAHLRSMVESSVVDRSAITLLHKMVDVVQHTLRTNLFLEDRYSLGLRLDPSLMHSEEATAERELPYGVVFCHGRRFNGYHVRFRDIARGGMRLVTPASPEQLALESGRHYDECYGLSFAQQMKNKDIPEGGSKCVCLIDTVGMSNSNKQFVMRKSVKAFSDSILDLIVKTDETNEKVVDYFDKPEVLYLGPDEQVIPDDINWIVERAAKRGLPTPSAFMSSKPRAGINHKEFGVTSEGVNVFVDVAVREVLKIDPTTTPFSVKLTGGTDGDVAGNEVKILFREYPDTVKVVGMCDHTGSLEDPDGLDREELLRLFHGSLPLDEFDVGRLGPEGALHKVDTDEGVKMRNTMHNRVKADVFIPAGGRPNTIDESNWRQFLDADGVPSSPLVVEGANLFITPTARQEMFDEAGILIVKDSSANKAGVICSSYEICAAMLLSEEEFLANKEDIVADVLVKLRQFAKVEAELLFREFENYPGALPHFSGLISDTINKATDAVSAELQKLPPSEVERLMPLVREHLPARMAEIGFERIDNMPPQYRLAAIASSLASKIVYAEGVNFVKSQPTENLSTIAMRYIEVEKEMEDLAGEIDESGMDEVTREKLKDLVKRGGVRTSLNIF
ncbi:hypothetical protein TrRE_jg3318 [Triparma retinervis]|uniref:Glutamate/phenylalanine/leucine/valine/L-tryptophan dehydrogenase C-terminal domain-containing protein n=1 Tax=Triparma retinervis TaxID=2557542 RepID=A0A9W7G635_9STRA|nr:hypothetical protein TrRE_jg3318 [Triparma retinervis]